MKSFRIQQKGSIYMLPIRFIPIDSLDKYITIIRALIVPCDKLFAAEKEHYHFIIQSKSNIMIFGYIDEWKFAFHLFHICYLIIVL